MKKMIVAVAILLGSAPLVLSAQTNPLTSLSAVHALGNDQASRHVPAAFEATVTYFRRYEKTLFVQDGDAAIYVNATTSLNLLPGDRILIRGTTEGSFRPIVISSDITFLRHGNPPRPARASYEAMIRSEFDCRYVVVRGTVRAAILTLSSGLPVTQMELRTSGGTVRVTLDSGDPAALKGLLDDEVEVTGVMSGQFDGKTQMIGLLLHSTSFKDVNIIRRAATDAWSLPVTPMDEVLKTSNVDDRSGRVRVEGTLTYYRQSSMAILQDGNRSIRVETPQVDRLRLGDRAEAVGIPVVQNDFLSLKLGQVRNTGPAPPIVAPLLSWGEIGSGKYAFNLVSIEGSLVSQVREQSQDTYTISVGNHLFPASVRHPYVYEWNSHQDPPPMPSIRSGSRVRVTGVVMLESGNPYNGAVAFSLLLRRYGDVVVVAPPPIVNVSNLLALAGLLIAIVFAVIGRSWFLERRVRREMAVAATIERRRSRILEEINRAQPLNDIIRNIVDLLSYKLKGSPCWCRLANGNEVGNPPADLKNPRLPIIQQDIPSHSGAILGTMFAATTSRSGLRSDAPDALFSAAQLAAVAIETRGLYSDLIHRSEFDLLTDIYNRFSLEKQLDRLIGGERREDARFALIYIDLDDFKGVNDQYGHRTGDLYLQEAAQRMNSQLRPGDMLARLGGDEFAALVRMVRTRSDVAEIASRLEHCFDEPFVLAETTIRGTASVGLALYPDDGADRDSLLSTADAAMYVAKNTRRARVETAAD